ncbi:M14 family zinc carboxypeptidase [Aquiflexum gelatinilyticum]|uniref:M14 family zinc carboxypeptidase n=1 Tax=Aquiflexum gelatinilyticum TaxID=2961943 RepID=A0A9X2P9A1_9BACT|nr:M14 family zinc carboxypeptidase [Aquiflexum gelatinilyticum]MCR9016678.1 M14 family zinc carboxypeptidase [Aquiflexum gelatinilyticum]
MQKKLLLITLLLLHIYSAKAQKEYYFPGETFSNDIPSPYSYLGYHVGEWHTRYDRLVGYFQLLADKSDMAKLVTIGYTNQLRPLVVLVISNKENISNLESIRTNHLKLVDPTFPMPDVSDMPAIVNLAYSVHGNEPSGGEASILTAYWLLASQSELAKEIRSNAVVMIDPAINPDGRDRHTNWANMHKGSPPVADPLDREHNEIWPSGRVNHYWFDLNRDWLPLAQVELQNKIAWYHTWYPNVVGDFHEMGTNATYFFEPTKPFGSENPVIPRKNYDEINNKFATYFAKALDDIGSLYWTKEVFDNSYPGYGSTYPDIQGGLGLVFEQASSRGHIQSSQRGDITFQFTIRNQLKTSIATMEAGVKEREYMHRYLREYFQTAITEASKDKAKGYIFGDESDDSRNRLFLKLLLDHKIKVLENDKDITSEGKSFKKGKSWIVPTSQPQYRMVRSMFEKVTTFADSVFYDASSWTMALAYGMPYATQTVVSGKKIEKLPSQTLTFPADGKYVAYLVDWSDYFAPKFLHHIQSAGVHVEVTAQPFTSNTDQGSKEFTAGSLVIPTAFQKLSAEELRKALKEAADLAGQNVFASTTGFSLKGIDLGSGSISAIQKPKVLMLVGQGTSQYEAGEIWHLMDTKVGMQITKVDLGLFGRVNLFDYTTLILPSGNYSSLSAPQIAHLKDWLSRGGTIISMRTASQWLQSKEIIQEEFVTAEAAKGPESVPFADARNLSGAQEIGGSIYLGKLDTTHPLGFGYKNSEIPVYRNTTLFFKPSKNKSQTPVIYTANPLLGGYVSPANLEKIKQSASLLVSTVGQGRVIHFIDNPNFRGTWFGTNKLFFNAIFFGDKI